MHEVTSPQAFDGLRLAGARCAAPTARWRPQITTRRPTARPSPLASATSSRACRWRHSSATARSSPSRVYSLGSPRQGIVHVIGPELGVTQPGMTIVCGDSHTSTHGAFGALAFGIGTSEVEHVLATQCLVQSRPHVDAHALQRRAGLRRERQGPDPRDARALRRRVASTVMSWSTPAPDRGALDGGAHDRLQHDDRGRRARRHDRSRRHDVRLVHTLRPAGAERRGARRAIEGWRSCAATTARASTARCRSTPARSPRSRGAPTRGWCGRSPTGCPRRTSSTAPQSATRRSARCATWRSSRARR